MDTKQTIDKLKALADRLKELHRDASWQVTINEAITLLQNKEKDTELLNAADDAWKPGEAHCVEITWGCGTHYKTCREALSELVTTIAAQQEAESV